MTMVISLGNRTQTILFADRRLSGNGTVVNDSYNKATVINTWNGRMAVGFTGLATFKEHSTQDLLVNHLYKAIDKADGDIRKVPKEIAVSLGEHFMTCKDINVLPSSARRLTILLAGYLTDVNPPALVTAAVSNFQDFHHQKDYAEAQKSFFQIYESEKDNPRPENPTLIQRVGAYTFLSEKDITQLRSALEKNLPVEIIKEIGVGIIRRIADETKFLVGKDISVVTLPVDLTTDPSSELVYFDRQKFIEGTDAIIFDRRKRSTLAIRSVKIEALDTLSDEKPFQGKPGRNDLCYCGSKKKYKKCHGRN